MTGVRSCRARPGSNAEAGDDALQPPSLAHPLGTDHFGRDQLARLLYGGSLSLQVGLVVVAIGASIGAILARASLNYLGIGARPPTPEWGLMLAEPRDQIRRAWWLATFPGLAIMLTVISINLLGDGLHDAFDPWLKGRCAISGTPRDGRHADVYWPGGHTTGEQRRDDRLSLHDQRPGSDARH